MRGLSGKTVFITGASSGIGAALAREFARNGCHVALAARREDRLVQVAREIDTLGRRVVAICCDVRRDEDVAQAVEAARREFGSIDVVVANAALAYLGTWRNSASPIIATSSRQTSSASCARSTPCSTT